MKRFSILVLLLFLALGCRTHPVPAPADVQAPAVRTIAFGACADQARPAPVWDTLADLAPDVFLFLGDNVYISAAADEDEIAAGYAALAAKPGFARLRAESRVLATWDDHDYGINDGGAEHPRKDEFTAAFLDFFAVPEGSPRRSRPGIYDAVVLGPPGRRVQVLLLDTRTFRSPLVRNPAGESREHGRYVPNPDPAATLLGEAQWRWLESELRRPAEVRLIATSIQAIASDHGWEKWANLPAERRHLLRLIRSTGATGVVLLSGDRHLAELAEIPADDPERVGYPLLELTVGGLTHATDLPFERNRYRILTEEAVREPNFGLLTLDWERPDPELRFEIRDVAGEVVLAHAVALSALRPAGGARE